MGTAQWAGARSGSRRPSASKRPIRGAKLAVRGSLGGVVHPLLGELTVEQKYLLDLIYRGRGLANSVNERRWPFFQYVEQELYRQHELDRSCG